MPKQEPTRYNPAEDLIESTAKQLEAAMPNIKTRLDLVERVAMNIVYQLDDDSGASVEFRQANNDKRIDFVSKLILELLEGEFESLVKELEEKLVKLRKASGNQHNGENTVAIGKRIQELHWVIELITSRIKARLEH